MGKSVSKTIILLKLWIVISPLVAVTFLAVWLTRIYNPPVFKQLHLIFGYVPDLIDNLFLIQADINGMDIPMGYVYVATVFIVSTLIAIKIENNIIDSQLKNEMSQSESNLRKRSLAQKQRLGEKNIKTEEGAYFFGLFEMKFEYLNVMGKSIEDLEKLKKEYSKMLINKMKEKYPEVQYVVSNKVFMISNEFSIFDSFLTDIVRFFRVFQEINNEKCIGSSLILSFDCGDAKTNPKEVYRFLSKINDLCYLNKVIVMEKFVKKYKYVLTKQFITISLGLSKIEIDNQNEIDVELHYLENY